MFFCYHLTEVIFSHFDVYFIKHINNPIFQIFAFNGLGDTLYYYIVPSTILINVIYFNFIIYQGINNKIFVSVVYCSSSQTNDEFNKFLLSFEKFI